MAQNITLKAVAPQEAIKYFRDKGYKFSFNWRDTWQEQHAYAFTVAKAMRSDILQDIRTAVDAALANGTTLQQFQKDLQPTLEAKGWWGRKSMTDPLTGEVKDVQLGSARRLKTIYDTNLRTAYAAGHWQRIERVKQTRPYLRYVHNHAVEPRPQHLAWNNTVLPVDDSFWIKFYPPNGWGCHCTVQQLSVSDLNNYGLEITKNRPNPPEMTYIDKRNGLAVTVPDGIDPGFAYNPGMAKLKALVPPPLDKPLDIPYMGDPAAVPLPPVRKIGRDILYPQGKSDRDYIAMFLKEFGATPDKPAFFKDVAGENLVISDDLFKTAQGRLKLGKDDRAQYLGLLALTIQDPDEVWFVWEEYPKGRWTLRRKYLSRFDMEGEPTPGFVLFDTGPAGWQGITTFKPKTEGYIDRQRKGALVYRRTDGKKN